MAAPIFPPTTPVVVPAAAPETEWRLVLAALRAGEVVALPTETVYGLAADATSDAACRRIFSSKGRPFIDPLIVHVLPGDGPRWAQWGAAAEALAAAFWPGPLTMVRPGRGLLSPLVSAGLPSVALRSPAHPLFQRMLRESGLPLAAPSANPFGGLSPTTADHVVAGLGGRIGWVVDGGPTEHGVESTIIDLRDEASPRLLRPGPITRSQLAAVLGRAVGDGEKVGSGAQVAPGQLASHYAPRTPLAWLTDVNPPGEATAVARIYWRRPPAPLLETGSFWLTEDGEAREGAQRLFALLHLLDARGYRELLIEPPPRNEATEAIYDRLSRAIGAISS